MRNQSGGLILTRDPSKPGLNTIVINGELVIEIQIYKGSRVKVRAYQIGGEFYQIDRGEVSEEFADHLAQAKLAGGG